MPNCIKRGLTPFEEVVRKELLMSRRIPKPGDIYKHFKGKRYKILHIAVSTETGEDVVVFETVQGDHKVYVSLLESFMSPLDIGKYPYTDQKYRFELCRNVTEEHSLKKLRRGNTTELILEFLDLDDNESRAEFLQKHQTQIDSRFLTAAAESLEFTERAETVEERYSALLRFLRTKMKYEGGRLR